MPKTCADWLEGWVFCGLRILTYKYERGRAVARSDEDATLLGRVAARMRDEMRKESARKAEDRGGWLTEAALEAIVLQTNGDGYSGPLLSGRFQVMESFVKGSYYVVDHLRDDLLVRVAGLASDTRRFATVGEAEAYTKGFTLSEEGDTGLPMKKPGIPPGVKENHDMAKVATKKADPKALTAAKKAAAVADRKIDTKKATPKASAASWKNQAEAFRTMIGEGKMADDAILAAVKVAFPDKKVVGSSVAYYRARMG